MKTSLACLTLIAALPLGIASARTWTSVSGATLDAEYAGQDGPSILLERANGSRIKIDIEKLSEADRDHLKTLEKPVDQEGSKPKTQTRQAPLFGSVTYETPKPFTVEEFPKVPLKQPITATYWGFQYGPSAEEVLYIAFDQPTLDDLHDTAHLFSPGHPKYREPLALLGKKSKLEENRVMRFPAIRLLAEHGDLRTAYDLEFVYGYERPDIVTLFADVQLARQGPSTRFTMGSHITEQVVLDGEIPVVQALRPIQLKISTRNRFGRVDALTGLSLGDWHLLPKSGMDKDVRVQVIDPQSGRTKEKVKIPFEEDAITSTGHGGMKSRLEKVERGNTYRVNASINLGSVLGVTSNSCTLKMPDEKEDD